MIEKFMSVSPKPESYGYGSLESMISVLEQGLSGKSWIMGERFTAADVLLGFSVHIPDKFGLLPNTATFQDYVVRCRTRPALQTALSWGDPQT